MKLKLWFGPLVAVILGLFGCRGDLQQLQDLADREAATRDDEGQADLGDEEIDTYLTEVEESGEIDDEGENDAGERVPFEELPESHQKVLGTLKDLHGAIHLAVAECAGFGAEASALDEAMEASREAGLDPKAAREQNVELWEALRTAMEGSKEAFPDKMGECAEASRESELGLATKAVMDACFVKPAGMEGERGDRRGPPPPGAGFKGKGPGFGGGEGHGPRGHGKGGKGMRGKEGPGRHGGGRLGPPPLPPPEFADFESDACVNAVDSAAALLL